MKIQKHILLICKLVMVLLVLVGCASLGQIAQQPSITPSPMATLAPNSTNTRVISSPQDLYTPVPIVQQPSITPSPIATLAPSPTTTHVISSPQDLYTPVPTITTDELERMVGLLQSKDCKLPCYLGITPGKTMLSEAIAILISLGGSHVSDYTRKDGATEYFYNLWVGDPTAINDTPEPNGSMVKIIHHVSLITNNNMVQIIEVYIVATKSMDKFQEYWSRFTTREIFLQNGLPDHLYVDRIDPNWEPNGRYLVITYEKLGAIVQLYGPEQDNNICPKNKAKLVELLMSLFTPSTALDIYNGRVPPTDRAVLLPINEVLGVNTKGFYNRVVSDPSACFEPKEIKP